jgi:hypothetical protein
MKIKGGREREGGREDLETESEEGLGGWEEGVNEKGGGVGRE